MKAIKEIIKLILSLVLAVLIISSALLNVAKASILEEKYILGKLEESNYYETTYQDILNEFDNYILQSGLDENTLQDICSVEMVKEDTKKIIENIYQGTKHTIDTQAIREKLNSNIDEQLKDTIVTGNTTKAIKQLVDTICKEYENKMFKTNYEQKINTIIGKANTVIGTIQKVLYIAIIVVLAILLILTEKNKRARVLVWIGISIVIAGIFLIIIELYINSQIVIQNITLLSKSISTTLQIILKDIFSKILTQGLIFSIVGIILIIIGNMLSNMQSKNSI